MTTAHDSAALPPAIILGGDANALSVAWSLGGAGIKVYAINHPGSAVKHSRYAEWIDVPLTAATAQASWQAYLLGPQSDHLRGAVLLTGSDEGIEIIAKNRPALCAKFRLDLSNPAAQLCMLNKLCTYQAARAAGVPTPKFWVANSRRELEQLRPELVFPLIVKPLLIHEFERKFSGKFLTAENFGDLARAFDSVNDAGVKAYLVEKIPGADDRLCSYYTYLDENGNNLFDFTKRIIRRYPVNMGGACYHITDKVPEVKELSLKLFRQVGLRGVANAEFKLDERDGQLKLMECNARFTAADCLVRASGVNISLFVYNRLLGRAHSMPTSYRLGLRLWSPSNDFNAYRELRRMGLLNFGHWIRSILHPQVFPYFRWYDPLPATVKGCRHFRDFIARRLYQRKPA
jgi:predicted ATP-grasp superfamily ATP-dependent carboligase